MKLSRKTASAALAMIMLSACDDEAMVGSSACREADLRCGPSYIRAEPLREVSSAVANVQSLVPTWVRDLELHGTEHLEVKHAVGAAGTLWVFRRQPTHLSVSTFDAAGQLTGQKEIVPPAGVPAAARGAIASLGPATSHPLGPVLALAWACVDEFPADAVQCGRREHLVFGANLTDAPARVPVSEQTLVAEAAYRTHDGNALVLPSVGLVSIRKVDLRGALLWKSDLYYPAVPPILSPTGRLGFLDGHFSAALLADDTLVMPVSADLGADWGARNEGSRDVTPVGLVRATSAGALSTLLYDTAITRREGTSVVVVDRENQPTVVNSTNEGDLVAVRLRGMTGVGHRVVREDFTELGLRAVAVDEANAVYVAAHAGERAPEKQRNLLCRLPAEADGRCFAIEETRALTMDATAPGLVYVMSARGLARYDVPQD